MTFLTIEGYYIGITVTFLSLRGHAGGKDMIPYERRLQIAELLEQNEVVALDEFCKSLGGVSESTVRRDLKTMEKEGEITLLRGGGACLKRGSYEVPVLSKKSKNVKQKEGIAKVAASLVNDGDSIYIDSGSTALDMVKYLKDKNITVVTTNALICSELQSSNIKCIIAGGEINITTASIRGITTNNFLKSYYFDKAFVGISGFSKEAGFNTPDLLEAEKKRIVCKNSGKAYIVADSSKSGKNTLCKVLDLEQATLICDKVTDVVEAAAEYIIAE